jgi:hypothetical protein
MMSTFVDADGVIHDIPAIVVQAEAEYLAIEAKIDGAEGDGVMARWEFGRRLLAERKANGGNQLPHGRLDEVCLTIGKSRTEIQNRVQFAEQYEREEVPIALGTFGDWHGICEAGLGSRGGRSARSASTDPAEWTDDELHLREQLENGDTVVINMRGDAHPRLTAWANSIDLLVKIDRSGAWGNPFELPGDGDRETVIRNYADHYLPHKPSLIDRLGDLQGKALGCWCAPEPCHGDVLKREADGE